MQCYYVARARLGLSFDQISIDENERGEYWWSSKMRQGQWVLMHPYNQLLIIVKGQTIAMHMNMVNTHRKKSMNGATAHIRYNNVHTSGNRMGIHPRVITVCWIALGWQTQVWGSV